MRRSGISFWSIAKSVAAAFFGVQSNKNRERDFRHGKPAHFIVFGVVLTVVFIVLVWGAVQLLIHGIQA